MNSEFRVWCKDNEDWEKDLCYLSPIGLLYHSQGAMWIPLQLKNHIVEFYTGLDDKNAEKIFKGDICEDDKGTIVEIVWIEDKFQFGAKVLKGGALSKGLIFPLWQWNNCKENGYRILEVIGNIHQNKDLLEQL